MNARERKRKAAATAAAMKDAVADMVQAGAIGFHLVAILPNGDYHDAYDCDDLAAMTAAVNDSALKARTQFNRGDHLVSVH